MAVAILSGPERRRRWTEAEKLRLVEETLAPEPPKPRGGKRAPGEGLFSLRLPKFESYQPGMLNMPRCHSTSTYVRATKAKSLPQLHVGNPAARTRPVS